MRNINISEYTKNDVGIVKSFKYKSELCSSIFDNNFKMHDDVKNALIDISDKFIDFLKIKFFIHDVVLLGSLANYNWSKYSDVDLHIIVDFENYDYPKDFLKEFFDAKKAIWNENHNIKIKNFDVEIYVQDISEKNESDGVYSILNNKWIKMPKKNNTKIDKNKILRKADEYANKIDVLIDKFKRNEDVEDKIFSLHNKIKNFRKSGLSGSGEASYENLTFKLLRRNGYIGKLLELKNNIVDKNLTIKQ